MSGFNSFPSPGELQRLSDIDGHARVGDDGDDRAELHRLAQLSPVEYDRIRRAAAERLGIRTETLDREVGGLRNGNERVEDGFLVTDPDPWPYPVNGASLLDLFVAIISKHLVLPPMAAEATALWVIHAHAIDAFSISPILAVTSPTPECGKTTLLTLLGAVVPRPLTASNITGAALFRAVEEWHPTLIIDEADTFLKDSDELRGIVNSGHNRMNAYVIRAVGEEHTPKAFSTWGAKVIALIGKLHPTLDSRSIHIELRRLGAGEAVEPLRGDRLHELEPLRRMAWRWAQDSIASLRVADPTLPSGLRGRAADNWRPLIAIADVAGGDWPEKARRAAEALGAGRSEQTVHVVLLDDIRAVFAERRCDRLTSGEIVAALVELEDRPWAEWKSGKPLSVNQLAALLKPFKISPKTMRISGHTPGTRGYDLSWFDDAFARYLPGYPSQAATPPQLSNSANFEDSEALQAEVDVAVCNGLEPAPNLDCGGVAVWNPEPEQIGNVSDLSDDDIAYFRELAGEG